MVNKGFVSPIEDDLKEIRDILKPSLELQSHFKTFDIFRKEMFPKLTILDNARSQFFKDLSPTARLLNNYPKDFITSYSDVFKRQERIWKEISPSFKFFEKYQGLSNILDKMYKWDSTVINSVDLSKLTSSLSSIFAEENIRDIDFSGVEPLEPTDGSTLNITLTDSITVVDTVSSVTTEAPKKKLIDMTDEDLKRIITGAITAAGGFSIAKFIVGLYSEYIADAAKMLIEIVFVFSITFLTGQYNDHVKSEIHNRIEQTMVVKDVRKVITRYVKVNPTDQVAFLRKESFIRLGSSKTSPVSYFIKFPKNTVFTVLERRNNWIKVEVFGGEFDGERGWIEKSNLIKFKKINY